MNVCISDVKYVEARESRNMLPLKIDTKFGDISGLLLLKCCTLLLNLWTFFFKSSAYGPDSGLCEIYF